MMDYWRRTIGTILFVIFLGPILSFADETINGHYCYTYGDNESIKEARELTRSLAIRNAIESYRIFAATSSSIKNFQLTNDMIQTISSGYLKDLKVKKHSEKGRTICDTIEANISPQEVENILQEDITALEKQLVSFLKDYDVILRHLKESVDLSNSAPSDNELLWLSRIGAALNETMDANLKIMEAGLKLREITNLLSAT